MHPIIANEATKQRLADWRSRAERNHMKHARHCTLERLATVLARRVRAALAAAARDRHLHDPLTHPRPLF